MKKFIGTFIIRILLFLLITAGLKKFAHARSRGLSFIP